MISRAPIGDSERDGFRASLLENLSFHDQFKEHIWSRNLADSIGWSKTISFFVFLLEKSCRIAGWISKKSDRVLSPRNFLIVFFDN